jgi:hypothetical protein
MRSPSGFDIEFGAGGELLDDNFADQSAALGGGAGRRRRSIYTIIELASWRERKRGCCPNGPAILPATAALFGSLVGGVSTLAASWLTQCGQLRAQTLVHEAVERETL